jgi:small-conductance mechanosensitive channel
MISKQIRYKFINRSLVVFFTLLIISSSLLFLHLKGIITIHSGIINIVRFFFSSAIVVVVTSLLLRWTVNSIFSLFEKDLDLEQRILLTKVYTIFIYTISFSVILYIAGVGLTDITLFLGLIATGIALAVRDIIMSFFIWLIILTKRPFRIGDVITSADDTGIVDRIGTFYVTLKVKNGQETHLVRVPNKMMLDRNMKNHGKNKISGEIRLKIFNIPQDLEAWISSVQESLKMDGTEILTSIETDSKDLQLSVKYLTGYATDHSVRLKILSTLFSAHKDALAEAKDGKP